MPASMPRPCRLCFALLFFLCTLLCGLLNGGTPARAQAVTLLNPSFETPAVTVSQGYVNQPTNAGWTIFGDAGIALGNYFNGSGPAADQSAPDGAQVGYIQSYFNQSYSSLSQTVSGLQVGQSYFVIVAAAPDRYATPAGTLLPITVTLGTQTYQFTPVSGRYQDFTVGPFTASAGSQTLSFSAPLLGANVVATAMIDNVRILAASSVALANFSFETPTVPVNPGYLQPGTAGWTFTGASGIGLPGYFNLNQLAPDGSQVGWVQTWHGNVGSISQSMNNLQTGQGYYVIVAAAQRGSNTQPVSVGFGSQSVQFTPASSGYQDYIFGPFIAGGVSQTLSFGSVATGQPDTLALLDNVRVVFLSPASTGGLRVDSGSASTYTDTQGKAWAADNAYSGGTTTSTSTAISSTSDPTLYQTQRGGSAFSYTLSVPNGNYVLDLLFAEIEGKTTGQRVFTVTTGSRTLLDHFDIAGAVGQNAATTRVFTVPVTNGQLTLNFTGNTGNAALAGLLLASVPSSGGILPSLPGQSDAAPDIPAPGWAEDMTPTDASSDADGLGPSAAGPVNLASGVEENDPGADLGAYNPVGPSVTYERRYRSARAKLGYGSPGLSPGWTDNYDLFITPKPGGYTLTYDNGATESWTGGTGALGTPSGAPYLVSVAPDLSTLTMTFKDRSKYIFTYFPAAGGNYGPDTFLLTNITNLVGRSVTINRDTALRGYRILSITNDAPTPLTLLSFGYDGSGRLSAVTDAYTRQINYGFSSGNLSSVSQINSTAPLWQYGYLTLYNQPFLSSVQTPDPSNVTGLATSLTDYYDNGTVAIHQDAVGRVRSYGYQNAGSKTFIQADNADGSLAEAWTQKNLTLGGMNTDGGTIDAAGKADSIAYGGMSSPYLPSAATNRNNQTAQVTYFDHYGNVLSVTSPRNVVTTYTYGSPNDFLLNQVASVTQTHLSAGGTQDDSKEPTRFTYYGPTDGVFNGLLKTVVSPKPDTTVLLNPSTVPTTYSYTTLGNVWQTSGPNANGTRTVTYNYTSDSYTDPGGTVRSYGQIEALGQPLSVTVSGPDAFGATTSTTTHYRYDARGNRLVVIDALGIETDFAYNLADQLTTVTYPATNNSGTGRSQTTTAYQYLGGPASGTSVFDETGNLFRQVAYIYGPEGELLTTTGSAYPVLYAYDGRGRVNAVTYYQTSLMDGHTTFYDYDPEGNLAAVRYPNVGQSGPNFDKLQYLYDADGNLTQEIDGVGVTKTYTRNDPESLLTGISYAYPPGYSGTPIGTLNAVTYGYDHWGRRISTADSATTKTYAYDDLDELLSLTTSFADDNNLGVSGPQSMPIAFQHYPDGSRKNWVVNNGGGQGYGYDGVGRLSGTGLFYTGISSLYSYLPNGWLTGTQTLYTASNFTTPTPYLQVDRTYNARGFLQTLTNRLLTNPNVRTTAALLSSFTGMTYDPDGNRLVEVATVPAVGKAPDLSRTVQYGYDTLDELAQEISTPASGSANTGYSNTFAYDLAGNPTASSRLKSQGVNAYNQLTQSVLFNGSTVAIPYNGNGDPLKISSYYGTQPAAYDPEDRLTVANNGLMTTFYDGDGLRAWAEYGLAAAPTYYVYDGAQPVTEQDNSGEDLFHILFGASGMEGRYRDYAGAGGDPTQIAYNAYTYDPQGSLVQPVVLRPEASNGATVQVAASLDFDAFGGYGIFDAQGSYALQEPVGFGGQYGYYRDYSGLYLLTHRYYDPLAGRFVTRDPVGYGGGINLYGLAGNNPVNGSDPDGTSYEPIDFLLDAGAVAFDTGKLAYDHYHNASAAEVGIDRTALGLDALGLVPIVPPGLGRAYALAHGGIQAAHAIQTLRRAQAAAKIAQGVSFAVGSGNGGSGGNPQQNRDDGNNFRDEIADLYRQNGYQVKTEVYKPTPWGARFIDIELRKDGKLIGGLETKHGGARYNFKQRMKDMWLKDKKGYIVNVVRSR